MTITREQVADLQPGDVVELRDTTWGPDVRVRGSLQAEGSNLICGPFTVRYNGGVPASLTSRDLTVVSRAPRPLYVNHPRTEPLAGDVVRNADGEWDQQVWVHAGQQEDDDIAWWFGTNDWAQRSELPSRLYLLVDGETGEVVR